MPEEPLEPRETETPEDRIRTATVRERAGIVEAILFVTGNAVEAAEIARALGLSDEEMDEALNELESECDFVRRGVRLLRYGKHVQLATRPEYAPSCRTRTAPSRISSSSAMK